MFSSHVLVHEMYVVPVLEQCQRKYWIEKMDTSCYLTKFIHNTANRQTAIPWLIVLYKISTGYALRKRIWARFILSSVRSSVGHLLHIAYTGIRLQSLDAISTVPLCRSCCIYSQRISVNKDVSSQRNSEKANNVRTTKRQDETTSTQSGKCQRDCSPIQIKLLKGNTPKFSILSRNAGQELHRLLRPSLKPVQLETGKLETKQKGTCPNLKTLVNPNKSSNN